jgi:hypothetical protein
MEGIQGQVRHPVAGVFLDKTYDHGGKVWACR